MNKIVEMEYNISYCNKFKVLCYKLKPKSTLLITYCCFHNYKNIFFVSTPCSRLF